MVQRVGLTRRGLILNAGLTLLLASWAFLDPFDPRLKGKVITIPADGTLEVSVKFQARDD